jgi:hypothetical protein
MIPWCRAEYIVKARYLAVGPFEKLKKFLQATQ